MILRSTVFWFLQLSIIVVQNVCAAENGKPSAGQPSLEAVQQKLQLVRTLLAKSPAFERANRSDNATVKRQATTARTLYANANDALNAGDNIRAEKLLDEALQLIETTTRQTPDSAQLEREQQARYVELLESVHNLLATFHDMRLRLTPKAAIASPVEPARVRGLIDQAQTLAKDHHYREAGELLSSAHAEIITALNQLLKSTALMYDLKFKSPAEEFEYEMSRYLSYEELVPIAYAELKPGEESIKLSEHFVQESRELRNYAKQQAAGGDLQSATDTIMEAVKRLQAALRTVGLVMPE